MIASLALPGIVHGCSSPTSPPTPPGGGHTMSLSFETFQQTIDPILTQHGCDTVAGGDCHGGGINGSLRLSPPGAKDAQFDFDQVRLQVSATAVDQSPILTEPLADSAGGTPHGFKTFATTDDPDYQSIRQWIVAGVPAP